MTRAALTAGAILTLTATSGCTLLHRHRHEHDRAPGTFAPRSYFKARKAERYIGLIATDGVSRAARFHANATVVKRVGAGDPPLPPRPGRLVLEVNGEGRIVSVACR